jgi:AraC-like DNA-binding protein
MNPTLATKGVFDDLLQNLQIHLIEARLTKCSTDWRDLDYTPNYNKFYLICEGEGWLRIGNQELYPKPGQLCFIPAYVQQSYNTISEDTYFKYWLHFTAQVGSFDLFQWLDVPFILDVQDLALVESWFQQLTVLVDQSSILARLQEKAILLQLIAYFLEQVPVNIVRARMEEMDRLTQIQQFIESRLHTQITVEHMAKSFHLHPNYFIKYFKKHFGMPPLKYMRQKRIQQVRRLLTSTDLSVKEIADTTGFDDTNHLGKIFRKETGYSPTSYRAQFQMK